jgi:hypothetical protein
MQVMISAIVKDMVQVRITYVQGFVVVMDCLVDVCVGWKIMR